jgi:Spy/CpxP family protein refolding chaperone
MKPIIYFLCALLLFSCPSALAQQKADDPIGENLIPPDLLLRHQQEIGLSADQREFIKTEVIRAQARFTDLQFQLAGEAEALVALVKQDRVDEQQTLAQLDKILALEREIKRAQFVLVIRIKNRLTPEQYARLQELRNKPQAK